jgi:uncharacterized membrane protein required for colicin V production
MIGSINLLDVALPLLAFGGVFICFRRGLLPTLMSTLALFIAFTVAALLYSPFLNFVSNLIGSPNTGQNAGGVIFAGMTLALYGFFEWMVRRNYPNLRINRLGSANNIFGGVLGVVLTALALSLILLAVEYTSLTFGNSQGGESVYALSYLIGQSKIVPLFRSFFGPVLNIEKLLFPSGLPDVLIHFVR